MGSIQVIVGGRLVRDPETNKNGFCRFSIPSNYLIKGEKKTEWNKIVIPPGKTAENCQKYLSKGRNVFCVGKNQTSEWKGKDGNQKSMTEIMCFQVDFLDSGSGQSSGGGGQRSNNAGQSPEEQF